MGTYFAQVSLSYTNVPLVEGSKIPTAAFLEATEGLIKMFGMSGPFDSRFD